MFPKDDNWEYRAAALLTHQQLIEEYVRLRHYCLYLEKALNMKETK